MSDRFLAESMRAATISAMPHAHLKRLPVKRKSQPPHWLLFVIVIATVIAFMLGRIT